MIQIWVGRHFTPIPGFIGYSVISIFVGLILGLEHLAKEFHKDGRWIVNMTRLIIMGVPSGIFAFYLVLVFTLPIAFPPFLTNTTLFHMFSGIIFGYTIMTSFYKKKETTASGVDKNLDI